MYNNLEIAKSNNIKSFAKAMKLYRKRVSTISSIEDLKDYLNVLNVFLYTYFLCTYKKDLSDKVSKNRSCIEDLDSFNELINFGESMLSGYRDSLLIGISESDHELVEGAIAYINKNFRDKITLSETAKKLHISKNYLCHLFTQETGYRFCEYINIKRIGYAKELICENKKNFEFISCYCGFSSQSHFSTTFKKYTGITPNEYKQKVLQKSM